MGALNSAASVAELDLDEGAAKLLMDFDDSAAKTIDSARCKLMIGPLKSPERAAVKALEYEKEIDEGKKSHTHEADGKSRRLHGCDYVLDWLRATVVAQDPFNLYVFFALLCGAPRGLLVRDVPLSSAASRS